MAFNQQFNGNSYQGYSNGQGYHGTAAPYRNGHRNAPARQYTPRKHSGAKYGQGENKKPFISAWLKRGRDFFTLIACPNSKGHIGHKDGSEIKNGKGESYARWTGTLTNKAQGTSNTVSCLYNTATRKLYVPVMGCVANPSAPNGGYFGKSSKPKNNR